MLIVNASFVGGMGAARKILSFTQALKERKVDFCVVTDNHFRPKLKAMGVKPNFVIPWVEGNIAKYDSVEQTLKKVRYDMMVSFGWRTYVPYDAVQKDKPCVIIDGGWPEVLQEWPGEFCHAIYQELKAYCLTTHFYAPALDNLLPQGRGIRFQWIGQPLSDREIQRHHDLIGQHDKLRREMAKRFPKLALQRRFVFLNMAPDYIDPRQFSQAGGFLTGAQQDECRGFVTRLIVELDQKPDTVLFMLKAVASQFRPVLRQCQRLVVLETNYLAPDLHHRLRCAADVVLCRAIRDVSSAQTALSGANVLHTICPAREGYMGEWDSARIATKLGIAQVIRHENVSLREIIMAGVNTNVVTRSSTVAGQFTRQRNVEHLLRILGG